MGSSLKPKNEVISPEETMRLLETQHRWNNPNQSNIFGDTVTTFGPDGQPTITQTPSETMQGLIQQQQDFVGQGAPQLDLQRDPYANNMMNQFNSRVAQRSGFSPMGNDQMANIGQPISELPQGRNPINEFDGSKSRIAEFSGGKSPITELQGGKYPMLDNAPDNGVPIGDGSMKPNFMDKMKKFGTHMTGEDDPKQALIKALMGMGKR